MIRYVAGGYRAYLSSFDPGAERRPDPVTHLDTGFFVPYQEDPAVIHRDRFRPVSPFGKFGLRARTERFAPQPIIGISAQQLRRKPDRPDGGKPIRGGYVNPAAFPPQVGLFKHEQYVSVKP